MNAVILLVSSIISAQPKLLEYLKYHDSRDYLNSSQQKIITEAFPQIAKTIPTQSSPWADVDPLKIRTRKEQREARRLAFVEALDPYTVDTIAIADSMKDSFRILLENRFKGSTIFTGSKVVKISTEYSENYESSAPDLSLIQRNLLHLVAELGAQWTLCGGEKLYLYNGPILMAAFESGRIRLIPLNMDAPKSGTHE